MAAFAALATSFSFGCAAYSAGTPRAGRASDAETFAAPPGTRVNGYGGAESSVKVPMFFPIAGARSGFEDSWGAPRDGHRHIGQDLFAPKLTPLVAAFDGTVYLWQNGISSAPHYALTLLGDNGYRLKYMHLNNDLPGTDNGQGGAGNAYAPGLQSGQRVTAGQFLGWVGDSGNAETTPPHLHFELWTQDGPTNAYSSLRASTRLGTPRVPSELRTNLPRLAARQGETRLDGLVRTADGARGVVQLTPLVETRGQNARVVTRPGARWVRLSPSATVVRADNPTETVRLSSLRFGDRIAIVGKPDAKRGSLIARRIAVDTLDVASTLR